MWGLAGDANNAIAIGNASASGRSGQLLKGVSEQIAGHARGITVGRLPMAVRDFSDASMFNGDIDWPAYFRANDLVYVKATEGTTWRDPYFRSNARVNAIHAAHGTFGAYHFAAGGDPKAEADHHVNTVRAAGGLRPGDLASVLDVERGPTGKVGWVWVRRWKRQYRRRLRQYGIVWQRRRPQLYTGSFWHSIAGGPLGMRWWYAAYVHDYHPYLPATLANAMGLMFAWQFTDRGTTSGLRSPHDRSHFLGGRRKLRRMRLR